MSLLDSSTFTSIYIYFLFFFNDTATTEIYTLSLHDALPIWRRWRLSETIVKRKFSSCSQYQSDESSVRFRKRSSLTRRDRKSTRLNSSHRTISYAVFCLKKKKKKRNKTEPTR